MVIDKRKTCFYFKFVYVHSTLSANKGRFVDSKYGFCRLVHGTPEGFVLGFLEGPDSASSADLITTATKT